MHAWLNLKADKPKLFSFHAREVQCFNKNKIGTKIQYGRHYQIARVKNNFAYVGVCVDLQLSDSRSVELMVEEHSRLFEGDYGVEKSNARNINSNSSSHQVGNEKEIKTNKCNINSTAKIKSIAFDRGYYSHQNKEYLKDKGIEEIYLPKRRYNDYEAVNLDKATEVRLHNRRAGIEAIIGHIKHGGQLRRSRMKSDRTTLSAGYSAVLGFNLRQLRRAALGKIRPITEFEQKKVV